MKLIKINNDLAKSIDNLDFEKEQNRVFNHYIIYH